MPDINFASIVTEIIVVSICSLSVIKIFVNWGRQKDKDIIKTIDNCANIVHDIRLLAQGLGIDRNKISTLVNESKEKLEKEVADD